jgi:hypothetical protein
MIMEEGANFVDILKAMSEEDILKKQLAIEQIAPRLQYAVVSILDIFHSLSHSLTLYTLI